MAVMFDTAFVNRNHVSEIPGICEKNPELAVIFVTNDVPCYSLFNAICWPERFLRVIAALVNAKE